MAQSQPVKPAESKPTLVSVEKTPERQEAPTKSSSTGLWILVGLAVLLGCFALWQTQQLTTATERIANLEDRVLGLDLQLGAAQTQIQTYEMQRGLVREAVSDISNRMNELRQMVGAAPAVASALAATPVVPTPETSASESEATASEALEPAAEIAPAP